MTPEKRRFSRIAFNVEATLEVDGTVHAVDCIVNLSVGGCMLEIKEKIVLGADCTFTILLPQMNPGVVVFGEVVRVDESRVSIKFTKIDPENLFHLQNVIRYNADNPNVIDKEISIRPGLK